MSDKLDAAFLRQLAARCVRLAEDIDNHHAAAELRNMAMICEIKAGRLARDPS